MERTNKVNEQTQLLLKKGQELYNSLRNSSISVCGDKLTREDKQCLAMYMTIINDNNFFNKILKEYGYEEFFYFPKDDMCVEHHEEEFEQYFNKFLTENQLEMLTLYLLDRPVIKAINTRKGYSTWKMKLGIYDYLVEKNKNAEKQTKSVQKVLTKKA